MMYIITRSGTFEYCILYLKYFNPAIPAFIEYKKGGGIMANATAGNKPYKPKLVMESSGADYSAVYAGEMPHGSENRPVLVFVPGLGASASCYWESNDMYLMAYKAGYRTAFTNFARGKNNRDMWHNGQILARQLEFICSFYKAKKLVLIAHSKGGVDSQAAAVHYGTSGMVEKLITLSTPHWGSQLADIAYSTAGWALAEVLHAHSDGCFVMQTGYMKGFRSVTDKKSTVAIDTFGGNCGGPELSPTWAGSVILSRYGENDGVVTVASSMNPTGTHYGTLPLSHNQICKGNLAWKYVDMAVCGAKLPPSAVSTVRSCLLPCGCVVRGGSAYKGIDQSFYADSTAESLEIFITVAGASAEKIAHRIKLKRPGGEEAKLVYGRSDDGSAVLSAWVSMPDVGKWSLTAPPGKGAYCLFVKSHGANCFECSPEQSSGIPLNTNVRILKTYANAYEIVGEYSVSGENRQPKLSLPRGTYNIELALSGELRDGSPFERTVIKPVTIVDSAVEADELIRSIRSGRKKHRRNL